MKSHVKILTKWSLQIVVHAKAALLSYHMQQLVAIRWPGVETQEN